MADTKISALPAATTPLAGTEAVPLVQSGTTKQATVENLATATQPNGTANSVIFLNGSKVPTTSSNLYWSGTYFAVGGAVLSRISAKQQAASSLGGFGLEASADNSRVYFYSDGTNWTFDNSVGSAGSYQPFVWKTTGTQRFKIDDSNVTVNTGNLVLGTAGKGITYNTTELTFYATAISRAGLNSTDYGFDIGSNGTSNTCIPINFNSNFGTSVGSITVGSTTAYNTTSDYRLKQNVQPMTGRLAEVMKLKPVTYNWKFDDSPGEGFIAHELAEVCPFAVTGEKDAVNEDGSIKPQSIDTSFLVATLVAAMQEQQQIITQLQAEVAALKNV